jgi:hypothetical protein
MRLMSVEAILPERSETRARAKGSAGLRTRVGGEATTVSALAEAGKDGKLGGLIKRDVK